MSDCENDRAQFYIDDHAVLFGMIAKSCEAMLGDKGLETCGKGVTIMGRERGLRSAMRCLNNGDDLTINNYFCYAELFDKEGWNRAEAVAYEPMYKTNTIRCGWFDTWNKFDLGKYAPVYCAVIDKSIVYGFNPELQLEMNKILASGDDCCEFNWPTCCFTDKAGFNAIMEKRVKLLPSITKDFLYQSGHLLYTLRRAIYLEHGLIIGKSIINVALSEYGKMFSPAKAKRIQIEAENNNYLLP